MADHSEERQALRRLVLEDYLFTDDESALTNSMSFLDQGILDSMGILEIIMFLEDNFQVKVNDEEMVPENLDSIDNLVIFIAKKRGA